MRTTSLNSNQRPGFTLVELLVAITILTALAVLVIPTLRVISKDRQAREAARFVGSAFASARSQAVIDGSSGIWIERAANLQGGNASIRIFKVRSPKPFTGYGVNSTADVSILPGGTMGVAVIPATHILDDLSTPDINEELEYSLFHRNDFIQFNYGGPRYRVVDVEQNALNNAETDLTFEISSVDPAPPAGDLPFKVYRRPVKVTSTLTELPRGYMIDLSSSGHGSSGFQFATGASPIIITFNDNGEIDTIYQDGLDSVDPADTVFPEGSVYLLVTEFKVDGVTNLQDKRGLWVTVNRNGGITSIGNMAEPGTGTFAQQLFNARSIARTGKSATQ